MREAEIVLRSICLVVLGLSTVACAPTVSMGAVALDSTRKKAVFDLNCDADKIMASVISTAGSALMAEYETGARGCGHAVTYRLLCGNGSCSFRSDRVETREQSK